MADFSVVDDKQSGKAIGPALFIQKKLFLALHASAKNAISLSGM